MQRARPGKGCRTDDEVISFASFSYKVSRIAQNTISTLVVTVYSHYFLKSRVVLKRQEIFSLIFNFSSVQILKNICRSRVAFVFFVQHITERHLPVSLFAAFVRRS